MLLPIQDVQQRTFLKIPRTQTEQHAHPSKSPYLMEPLCSQVPRQNYAFRGYLKKQKQLSLFQQCTTKHYYH